MIAEGMGYINKPGNIIPEDPKEREAWAHQTSDFMARSAFWCYNYEQDVLPILYALGNIPLSEFEHITSMHVGEGKDGEKLELPAVIGKFNYILSHVQKMVSRALSADNKFIASIADEESIISKLNDIAEKAADDLTRYVRQQAKISQQAGGPIEKGDDVQPVDIEKVMNTKFTTEQADSEIAITKGLAALMSNKDMFLLHKLIHQVLFNYLCNGKCAGELCIRKGNPDINPIPSSQLIYNKDLNSPFLQHGNRAGYWCMLTSNEILQHCPGLDKAQIKEIDERLKSFAAGTWTAWEQMPEWQKWWFQKAGNDVWGNYSPDRLMVFFNYFRGIKMQKAIVTPNLLDKDNPFVDWIEDGDDRQPNEEEGEYFSEEPRPDIVWRDIKIADLFHYKTEEMEGHENLPIIGFVDFVPSSVQMLMSPQRLLTEVIYTMERLMAQVKGNIIVIDQADSDNNPNNFYNMMAHGIMTVDSSKEEPYMGSQPGGSGGIKMRDMGMSSAFGDLFRMVGMLKQMILELIGSNETAVGMVKSEQTVGATQNSMMQAQLSQQATFDKWFLVYEMFGQGLADMLKAAYAGREKDLIIMGLDGMEYYKIKKGDLDPSNKHIISVNNSVKSDQRMAMIMDMAKQFLSVADDPMMALGIIKMANSVSSTEALQTFEKMTVQLRQHQDKIREGEAQQQQGAMAAKQKLEETKSSNLDKEIASKERIAAAHEIAETERTNMKLKHEQDKQEITHDLGIKEKIFENVLGIKEKV